MEDGGWKQLTQNRLTLLLWLDMLCTNPILRLKRSRLAWSFASSLPPRWPSGRPPDPGRGADPGGNARNDREDQSGTKVWNTFHLPPYKGRREWLTTQALLYVRASLLLPPPTHSRAALRAGGGGGGYAHSPLSQGWGARLSSAPAAFTSSVRNVYACEPVAASTSGHVEKGRPR